MRLHLFTAVLVAICISSFGVVAQSDDEPRIQEFFSYVSEQNPYVYFDLFGMHAGTTLYIFAESYDFDTMVGICDIDCEEVYETNDDFEYPKTTNSFLSYTFEEDGDYSVFVTDCCSFEVEGVFRIVMGLEAPQVEGGNVFPGGDPFAVIYKPTYIDLTSLDYDDDEPQAQQFYGAVDAETPFAFFEIPDAERGQTVYLYAESNEIDTVIGICYEECDEIDAFEDDISSRNLNTALEYTFEDDGLYTVIIGDCCDETASGEFRLLIGYNEPDILDNKFLPNSEAIANVYEVRRLLVQSDIDRGEQAIATNCADVELNERPELSGDIQTVETANFVIHYTTEGDDQADEDYVDEVVQLVEEVLEVQVAELGWAAPPRDCGEGGDTRYDFYLIDIYGTDSILGYAQPEEIIGDNPSSEIEEEWAAYGYMVIDNDYRGVPSPLVVMRATVAHEFHHLIQFGYDVADAAQWIYEATSSWMETKTLEDQDVLDYVESVFDEPNLCIGSPNDRAGLRIYGDWLLIDSIAQDFGDTSIIQLWEIAVDAEGMDVFYAFLDELDTTPEEILRRFAIRNLLLDYDIGEQFKVTVDVEETIEGFGTYDSGRDGIEELAVQYLFIRESGVYTFEIDNDDLHMILVGINPDDDAVDIYDIGTEGTVDTNPYDYSYVIVMNTNTHDDPGDCREEDWEIEVRDGQNEIIARPNGEAFDVSNFDPAD